MYTVRTHCLLHAQLYNARTLLVLSADAPPDALFGGAASGEEPIIDFEGLQFETAVEGARMRCDVWCLIVRCLRGESTWPGPSRLLGGVACQMRGRRALRARARPSSCRSCRAASMPGAPPTLPNSIP